MGVPKRRVSADRSGKKMGVERTLGTRVPLALHNPTLPGLCNCRYLAIGYPTRSTVQRYVDPSNLTINRSVNTSIAFILPLQDADSKDTSSVRSGSQNQSYA